MSVVGGFIHFYMIDWQNPWQVQPHTTESWGLSKVTVELLMNLFNPVLLVATQKHHIWYAFQTTFKCVLRRNTKSNCCPFYDICIFKIILKPTIKAKTATTINMFLTLYFNWFNSICKLNISFHVSFKYINTLSTIQPGCTEKKTNYHKYPPTIVCAYLSLFV